MDNVKELRKIMLDKKEENNLCLLLKELYKIIEHKMVKKTFLECYFDDKYDKEYLTECFKILIPLFYQDYISCNSFPEELAIMYIEVCTVGMLRKQYNKGIIFAMITNPSVNFKREIVEMYVNKLISIGEGGEFNFKINQKDVAFLSKYAVNTNYKYWDVVFDQIVS